LKIAMIHNQMSRTVSQVMPGPIASTAIGAWSTAASGWRAIGGPGTASQSGSSTTPRRRLNERVQQRHRSCCQLLPRPQSMVSGKLIRRCQRSSSSVQSFCFTFS
jgi:hypothetical protein